MESNIRSLTIGIGNISTKTSVKKSEIASARSLLISVGHSVCSVRTVVQRELKCVPHEKKNQKKNANIQVIIIRMTAREIMRKTLDPPVTKILLKKKTKLSFMKPIARICIRKKLHSNLAPTGG